MNTNREWEWRDRAACRNMDPNIFFPEDEWEKDKNPDTDKEKIEEDLVAQAKAICAQCPVRVECLDFAIGTREKQGIWGGLTSNQRRSHVKSMRKNGETIPKYTIAMPRGVSEK